MLADLERLGLVGEDTDPSTVTVLDGGDMSSFDEQAMPKAVSTVLGRTLLRFVAPVSAD